MVGVVAAINLWPPLPYYAAFADEVLLPFGGEFTINVESGGGNYGPAIAMMPEGQFTVLWGGQRRTQPSDNFESTIEGRRFTALAEPSDQKFQLYRSEVGHGGAPAIAYLADGSSLVAWSEFPDSDSEVSVSHVSAQAFAPSGEAIGAAFTVDTSIGRKNGRPTITSVSEDAYVVVWNSGYDASSPQFPGEEDFDLFARLVSASGELLGTEFPVNTTTYGSQGAPAIASLPGGGFVAAWSSVDPGWYDWLLSIFGQRFDAMGAKVGPELLIGEPDVGKRHLPAISSAPDGGFVVAWGAGDYDAEFSDPGARNVLVRRFGANGDALGAPFQAHVDSDGRQVTPAVTHLGNESFVVVWEDGDGNEPPGAEDRPTRDGDNFGLFGRAFDEGGAPAAFEFQVNTTTTGRQWFGGPTSRTIASDAEGNLVVVWESNFDRVVGRRYCHYSSAEAACGDVDCLGERVSATDALVLLQAAVGVRQCEPCVCDVDQSGTISGRDALKVLRVATELGDNPLACPECPGP